MEYTAKIKGFEDFSAQENKNLTLTTLNDNNYIINVEGQNYEATLLEHNPSTKQFLFNINGRIIDITMEDELDRLIEKMEFNKGSHLMDKNLVSPMPGVILSINVTVGEEVAIGDKLFTLEAMKMENIIKSATEGVVKSIEISEQEAVEKGQLLLTFE